MTYEKETDKEDLLKNIHDPEVRSKITISMIRHMQEARAKRVMQPLCHRLIHPFLGNGIFKDTCSQCGFSTVDTSILAPLAVASMEENAPQETKAKE